MLLRREACSAARGEHGDESDVCAGRLAARTVSANTPGEVMQPHGTARREGRRSRSGVATALVEREPRQLAPGVVHHGAGELHALTVAVKYHQSSHIWGAEEPPATSAMVTPSSSSWRQAWTR